MATTVHLPPKLLERLDARARALKVSRNRLIIKALEDSLAPEDSWSPEFREMLSQPLESEDRAAVNEMMASIQAHRSSKDVPNL
jgi:metal-responsive CopG/Arc/MetJ family transcriptional regulator